VRPLRIDARAVTMLAMVYCVVPRELEDELFEKLSAYYADDDGVTVIVDRREGDRRARNRRSSTARSVSDVAQRRVVRDRRRARVAGDTLPLALASS
jgi:hypothetical protein